MDSQKKKLIAAAISAAIGLPLVAQAEVTVYGKLYPQINHWSESGGTGPTTAVSTLIKKPTATPDDLTGTVMESSNSRLGFRGSEDLGNGLKALFQLEMALGVDDGTGKDLKKGVLFGRDTFVGMAGSFGTLKFGNLETVYKNIGDTVSFLGVSSGNIVSNSNILSKNIGANNASRFHERLANTIYYESPEFGGFQGLINYSLGEVAGNFRRNSAVSGGVTYTAGPVYLALAHERHYEFFGGSNNVASGLRNIDGSGNPNAGANSTDTATRLTAQYKFGKNTRVEANFAMMKLSESGGAKGKFESYKHNTWAITGEQKLGAWSVAATIGQAGAGSCTLVGGVACNTTGLDGKLYNLGASYSLSKRTSLFALYSDLRNGVSAAYSNVGDAPKPAVGQSIRQLAAGISHSF